MQFSAWFILTTLGCTQIEGTTFVSTPTGILSNNALKSTTAPSASVSLSALAPRIGDVLVYLEENQSLNWTNLGDGTRYVFHTYKEWTAAEQAIGGRHAQPRPRRTHQGLNPRYDVDSIDREPIGTRIEGGLPFGNTQKRASEYFCFESGQWASTAPLIAMSEQACHTVMRGGLPDGKHTWTSLGYLQADHNTAAWFIQSSGKIGDTNSIEMCQTIFKGFADGGVPFGGKPWCEGKGRLGEVDGQFNTQGGFVRWYNKDDNAWSAWKSRMGELRIDPNTCSKDRKPCPNFQNLAKNPDSMELGPDLLTPQTYLDGPKMGQPIPDMDNL